jgi:ubiquinone/menaquinone biosynthesis C-methylase UbiE
MKSYDKEVNRINNIYSSYIDHEKIYSRWSIKNYGNQFIIDEKSNVLRSLLKTSNLKLQNGKLLEVGCASGSIIDFLLSLGAKKNNICGIDIRPDRVKDAKKFFPDIKIKEMDARNMKFPKHSFDFISVSTLFSSVIDKEIRFQIASEISRVLKPSGIIIYYDLRFNNPYNSNIIGIDKKEINNLFPDMKKKIKKITLLPPLARRLGKTTPYLYPLFSMIPLLKSHYVGLFKK